MWKSKKWSVGAHTCIVAQLFKLLAFYMSVCSSLRYPPSDQIPASLAGKAGGDGPSFVSPATCVGDLDGILAAGLLGTAPVVV